MLTTFFRKILERLLLSAFVAVNKGLQPIKADLATIKSQLDTISTTMEDLSKRIESIETLLKAQELEQKKKLKVA